MKNTSNPTNILGALESFSPVLVIGLIIAIAYFPNGPTDYFKDDFGFIWESPASKFFYFFYHTAQTPNFYRPTEATLFAIVQANFGLNTLPFLLINLSLHMFLCGLIYLTITKLGFSKIQGFIGAIFMAISQANLQAVLSNDGFSQLSGTLFGCLSLWFLYRTPRQGSQEGNNVVFTGQRIRYFLSIGFFVLALLGKESSITFLIILLALCLYRNLGNGSRTLVTGNLIKDMLPYIVVTFLYLAIRASVVNNSPSFGDGRYNFNIGGNILQNVAMLLFACFVQASSVDFFVAFKQLDVLNILKTLGLTLILIMVVVYGIWRTHRPWTAIAFMGMMFIAFFPVALLNHVSELHAYNAMPFVSILIGLGLGQYWIKVNENRMKAVGLAMVMTALMIIHLGAIDVKASLMVKNGEFATMLLEEIVPHAKKLPENGSLLLLNPADKKEEYGNFLMRGFNVLGREGIERIRVMSNRHDIRIKIAEAEDFTEINSIRWCPVFTLQDGKLKRFQDNQRTCV